MRLMAADRSSTKENPKDAYHLPAAHTNSLNSIIREYSYLFHAFHGRSVAQRVNSIHVQTQSCPTLQGEWWKLERRRRWGLPRIRAESEFCNLLVFSAALRHWDVRFSFRASQIEVENTPWQYG